MPRLELVAGHMAANMANDVQKALTRWPVGSITIWMESTVATDEEKAERSVVY